MISTSRIVKLLVDRVPTNEELQQDQSRSNTREEEIISFLLKVIDNVCTSTSYEIESDATLDHDDEEEFGGFEDEDVVDDDESVDASFDEAAESEKMCIRPNFKLDYMKKVVEYYDARDSEGRRKHTWKSTQHRFKLVPHRQYIARFRHYIEQHGSRREKLHIIDDFVYDKFEEARDNVLSVHDRDLKRWPLQKATEESNLTFEASVHWLQAVEHRHLICSRKITKLVTRRHAEDTDAITESADSFLFDVKREVKNYAPEEILNTDQVGLELELHSTRTLLYEGEKFTMARVRSKNAVTHSYTVQPMISAAGKLVGPVFLCLKEPRGKMSETELIYCISAM